jgi:hypothetical protein
MLFRALTNEPLADGFMRRRGRGARSDQPAGRPSASEPAALLW